MMVNQFVKRRETTEKNVLSPLTLTHRHIHTHTHTSLVHMVKYPPPLHYVIQVREAQFSSDAARPHSATGANYNHRIKPTTLLFFFFLFFLKITFPFQPFSLNPELVNQFAHGTSFRSWTKQAVIYFESWITERSHSNWGEILSARCSSEDEQRWTTRWGSKRDPVLLTVIHFLFVLSSLMSFTRVHPLKSHVINYIGKIIACGTNRPIAKITTWIHDIVLFFSSRLFKVIIETCRNTISYYADSWFFVR